MFHIIATMICATFRSDESVGKWQEKKLPESRNAMLVSFPLPLNHDVEEGYRDLDILIYGPMNYVQVYVRKRQNTVLLTDLVCDVEGESSLKPGASYTKTEEPWVKVADHDSCWTEGVEDVLRENAKAINHITTYFNDSWWKVVPVASEGYRWLL